MKLSRLVAAGASALLVTGFGIGFAAPASANQVWTQQVQRASADAPCDIPAVEGEAAGWSAWAPSWAQWPNGGEGGWVCTRSITWAKDTPPPGASGGGGCVLYDAGLPGPGGYIDFGDGSFLLLGAPEWLNTTCTGDPSEYTTGWDAVYAPDNDTASAICTAELGSGWVAFVPYWGADPNVYYCSD